MAVAEPAAASEPVPTSAAAPTPSWLSAMSAGTTGTLIRGRWWLVALAAFLVRGGLLLVLPPLVVFPTPARLATLLSPSLTGTGLDQPTPALIGLLAAVSGGIFVALLATTIAGTWLDVRLVAEIRSDVELARLRSREVPGASIPFWSAVEVRLLAHLPTAIALVAGVLALGDATMAELTGPSGDGPLALRILARAPVATGAIVAAWFVGEAWGGLALRRLATTGSTVRAMAGGLIDLVRPSGLATAALTTAVVAVPVAALWLAAGRAFERLWPVLVEPSDDRIVLVGLGLLVASWAAGLWLLGISLAFRSAAWTAEAMRRERATLGRDRHADAAPGVETDTLGR